MPDNARRLKAALLNNRGLKALSVLLAVITWHAIQAEISHEELLTGVPLLINPPSDLAVLNLSARSIDVRVRGSKEDINLLTRDKIRVAVTLRKDTKPGPITVRLNPGAVKGVRGVRPTTLVPDQITMVLEPRTEKSIPVRASLSGRLPPGLTIEEIVCMPPSVTVSGPRKKLHPIRFAKTEQIDMEGFTESYRRYVPVLLPTHAADITIEPSDVLIDIRLAGGPTSALLTNLPVRALLGTHQPYRALISPSHADVEFEVRGESMETLGPDCVVLFADCSRLHTAGVFQVSLQVKHPPGLDVSTLDPNSVRVELREVTP